MWPSSNWLCLLTFTTLWTLICTAPTTPALSSMEIDVAVDDPQKTGCAYDDKFYKEGETVFTKEPCLNCTCRKGALRCHLQVCPYMHDLYPPPSGCVLVERKSACCPKLHCPTAGPGEGRLLRKDPSGQIATWRVREDLRKRLVKQLTKNGTDKLGCIESGTLYAEGSAMMTSSTCQYCFCLKGKQTCVKPQCAKPVLEGCTPRFRDLACCPTHYDCAMSTNNVTSVTATKKKISSNSAGGAVSSSTTGIRENDRIIDSPHTTNLQQQIPLKKLSRRKREDVKDKIEPPPMEEVMSSTTLGPDSLIDESQSSVTETTIPSATASTPASTPASTDEKTTTTKSELPPAAAVAVDASSDDQEPIVLLTNDVTAQKQKEDGKGQVEEENKKEEEKKEQEPKKQNLIPVAAILEETPKTSEESKVILETVDDSKSKPIPEGIEAGESQLVQEKDKPITEEITPDTSKIIPEKNSQVIVEDIKSISEESKTTVEIATMPPDVDSGVSAVALSDEGSSTLTPSEAEEDPSINSSWIPVDEEDLPPSSRLDEPVVPEEGPEPIVAEVEVLESDIEEKPIEFTVSSSLPSVGQQSDVVDEKSPVPVVLKELSTKMKPPPPPPPFNIPSNNNKPAQGVAGTQSNFLPIDTKVAASFSPIVPVPTVNDEQLPSAQNPDYDADYDNMELPPSLPNLEIIPFVAADAVMGLPENLDDDERLNLGGLAEQRTPLSHIAPTADQSSNTDFCFIDGSFYSHGEVIVVDDETTDPCTLCRCMLGQLVCHQTKCAPVPAGCRSVERPSFCCGQIVCGSSSLLTGQGAGDSGAGAPNNSTGFNDRLDEDEDTLIIESDSEESNGTEPEVTSKPTVSFSSSTSTSVFRPVTFPPRTSSTARTSAPVSSTVSTPLASSTAGNRFTLRKTSTTERSAITFRSKLNKPAVNNLVGASALPTGGLKIDSCNIYGQMYRVGRIIDELSGPCVECKCTEIGVNCTNLRC